MSQETPPRSDSILKNPQVIVAIIGVIGTVIVAVLGIVPIILNSRPAEPTLIVVTATSIPPTETAVPATTVQAQPTSIPSDVPPSATVTPLPAVPTDAPVPAPTHTSVAPTAAPGVTAGNVLLLYDEVSFSLLNQGGGVLSLENVFFRSTSGEWEARLWGPTVYNSLPAGMCLRLRDASVGQRTPPPPCRDKIYGLQQVGTSALFWIGAQSFDVILNGQTIATCAVASQSCLVNIP